MPPKRPSLKIDFKECTRCYRTLPLEKFERYYGKRGENLGRSSHSSVCKDCKIEIRLIRILKKKFKLVSKLFNGQCYKCGVGLEYLPSFEFHHLYPEIKTLTWNNVKYKSDKFIVNWAINEQVIPLCGNCHSIKKAHIFKEFKNFILNPNLFELTAEQIEDDIKEAINNHSNYSKIKDYKRNVKVQIKKYIRKRFVYEQLFKGRCIGCGKITIYNNLPTLELHHRIPEIYEVKSTWRDLSDMDCEEIIRKILEENCVCLCNNCHTLVRSKLHSYCNEVFDNNDNNRLLSNEIIYRHNTLMDRIDNYKLTIDIIDFKSPLKLEFPFPKDIWKIRLLQIYYFAQKRDLNIFNIEELTDILKLYRRTIQYHINNFLTLNYIKKVKDPILTDRDYIRKYRDKTLFEPHFYSFTKFGLAKASKLKKIHYKTAQKLRSNLLSMEDAINRQKQWII